MHRGTHGFVCSCDDHGACECHAAAVRAKRRPCVTPKLRLQWTGCSVQGTYFVLLSLGELRPALVAVPQHVCVACAAAGHLPLDACSLECVDRVLVPQSLILDLRLGGCSNRDASHRPAQLDDALLEALHLKLLALVNLSLDGPAEDLDALLDGRGILRIARRHK